MKRVTKADARARRAAWDDAVRDHRVLLFVVPGGMPRMTSYPTVEARVAAEEAAAAAGIRTQLVTYR